MKATIKTESKNRALKKKILLHITLLKLEKTNPSAVSVLQLLSLKTEKKYVSYYYYCRPPSMIITFYPEKQKTLSPPLSPLCHLLTLRIYCITMKITLKMYQQR